MKPITRVRGNLPRVLRRGTPVVVFGRKGVALGPRDVRCWAAWLHPVDIDTPGVAMTVEESDIDVDMADAIGRACVAWAVAAHLGADEPLNERLERDTIQDHPCWWIAGANVCPMSEEEKVYHTHLVVPSLAGLDMSDETRLPDDTLWTDAEALALVANHLLGGE